MKGKLEDVLKAKYEEIKVPENLIDFDLIFKKAEEEEKKKKKKN